MEPIYLPNEDDIKRWINDAVEQSFQRWAGKPPITPQLNPQEIEALLSRKEVAKILGISLVTLHSWMKRGLPNHRYRGRVYFLRSEVMAFLNIETMNQDKRGIHSEHLTGRQ